MASYRYLLGDVLTGQLLAELPLESASYSHVLNAPGSFQATMGLRQPTALASVLRDSLVLGRSTLYVEREGVIVWGGMLWTQQADLDAATVALGGEGWLSYFRRRVLRADKTYTGIEQVEIAADLLDWAQAQVGGDVGVVTADVLATGVTRDRTYLAAERKQIGEAIEQLAAVLDGFDFRFEDAWAGGDVPETRFLTSYPATGRVTDFVFETGKQVSGAGVDTDATALVSSVDVIGALLAEEVETEPLIETVTDTDRLGWMPLLDDVISFTDVSVPATLQAHGNARLNRGKYPIKTVRLEVDPIADPPLGAFIPGDNVSVRVDEGIEEVDGRFRIIDYTVRVDDSGDETMALGFANQEVFGA